MSQTRLAYLFNVYYNKTATASERQELMDLLLDSQTDATVKQLLAETWQHVRSSAEVFSTKQSDDMLASILKNGKEQMVAQVPVSHRSFAGSRVVAVALLAVVAVGIFIWFKPVGTGQVAATIPQKKNPGKSAIVAGGNKAVLTLADGSSIVLDSSHDGILASQGNVKVVKLNTATLAYNAGVADSQEVVYNTLATPNGGQYQLILPDGTKVWLNATSSIRFPNLFRGKERSVAVTGEAYFEVAKNAAMPFKITVKETTVEVLGTHFNIMAYDEESAVNTTLLEGSVKVSKGAVVKMLLPGQQSVIDLSGQIKVRDADIDEVMAWKNGWFQFNAADIKTVMRQIARWYDVEVMYEGKIPEGHFSGIVSRANDISQVLKIMQAGGVRFRFEGRKLIVLG